MSEERGVYNVGNELKVSESLIVGVDFAKGKDIGVLIVGRKKENEAVEVINAFMGDEAAELYLKLITKKNA